MKSENEVIREFNELVNMTARELEEWLKSDDSNSAGWPKEDENGETIGHDSGRKIVDILKANTKKKRNTYTDDQIKHMRKVVSYCKRHLAQEAKTNANKSPEELKKTKSYASLKNWGHDPLKAREENEEAHGSEEYDGEENTGDKRKAFKSQSGSNKKRETQQGASENKGHNKSEENGTGSNDQKNGNKDVVTDDSEDMESENDGSDDGSETSQDSTPEKGDTVSWKWGNGQPKGEVLDVKDEKATITTKNGNKVSRDGTANDPAIVIDAGKSKAIKLKHELNETE